MWRVYALLSALFAALTTILAKIGIKDVNSHLATALRTVVVLFMAWGMVFITGTQGGVTAIGKKAGCSSSCRGWRRARLGCFTTARSSSARRAGWRRSTS